MAETFNNNNVFIKFHNLGGLVEQVEHLLVEQMNIGLLTLWYNVTFTNDYVNL